MSPSPPVPPPAALTSSLGLPLLCVCPFPWWMPPRSWHFWYPAIMIRLPHLHSFMHWPLGPSLQRLFLILPRMAGLLSRILAQASRVPFTTRSLTEGHFKRHSFTHKREPSSGLFPPSACPVILYVILYPDPFNSSKPRGLPVVLFNLGSFSLQTQRVTMSLGCA